MDAYLINEGKDFSILYNKSKTLEETVETIEESRVQRFARQFPLYNLASYVSVKSKPLLEYMPFRNILQRITEWSARIIQSSNGMALTANTGTGQFVVHYADTMKAEEARYAFYRVARRETRRSSIAAAVNLALIPVVGYNPLTLPLPIPTSLVFLAGIGLSLRIRKKIKKNAKSAVFMPSSEISKLEKKIIEGGGKGAEDCFAEYDFT